MSSTPRGRLDFTVTSQRTGVSAGASSDDSRRREGEPAPQQHNAPLSAESVRHRRRSPFSPSTSFSPPIRNSLSSHASDMGRRLAQERSKNHELIEKIRVLEHTVSSLQQGKHDDTLEKRLFVPPSPAASRTQGGIENSSEKNDLLTSNHEQEPKVSLLSETQRGERSEKKLVHVFHMSELTRNSDSSEIASDSSIAKLLEQASQLLSENAPRNENGNTNATNPNSANSHQPTNRVVSAGPTHTQEQMREYHELVSAFYLEHESHGDIDGEEFVSREDITWLFQELKWRFEDILSVYADERSKKEDEPPSDNKEWNECLEGLANVVTEATKPNQFRGTNNQQGDEHTNNLTLTNNSHVLQNEVSSLNERLASFAAQHNETCRSLYDDMEATKRDYQEQIANKSQCIQNLETKISEQEEYISEIQSEAQKDKQWIQEEKRKLKLSEEGTSVRIRYLEGMLRSVQVELKESRTSQGKKGSAKINRPICTDGAAVEKERGVLSPPVFMRVLTLAMQDAGLVEHKITPTDNGLNDPAKDVGVTQKDAAPSSDGIEITKLQDQIASLGNSLVDSETRRADLLDDFQQERKKYILQYKQMSDILKQLIEEERMNNT